MLKERMSGMSVNIGIGAGNSQSFGVKGDIEQRDKTWTDGIASIIGREVVKVTAQQTLEIVGGLIANADISEDGTLTDKGKANIRASKIIAKQLHDFDDGYSYGLGLALSKNIDPKTEEVKYGASVPVKYGFNEKSRDLLPTIGADDIVLTDSQVSFSSLNRDIAKHIGSTSSAKAMLDANLPVSDIYEFTTKKPTTGVGAGDNLIHDNKDLERELIEEALKTGISQEKIEKFKETLQQLSSKASDPANLISESEREVGIKAAREYYQFLKENGDKYGEAAMQVANDEGFFGKMANIHLRTQAVFDGVEKSYLPELRDRIIISLTSADIDARLSDSYNLEAISEYHKEVFENQGLTPYSWGGLALEKLFGSGKWMVMHDHDMKIFDKILSQFSKIDANGKIDGYSINRMIRSIEHSFRCYSLGIEHDFKPTIITSNVNLAAKAYNVNTDRIEFISDETPSIEQFPKSLHKIIKETLVHSGVYRILPKKQ